MYEELIAVLRHCGSLPCDGCPRKTCEGAMANMREAADAIEELSREYESVAKSLTESVELVRKLQSPRWIPVTERLPEKDKWVLRYSAITEATWLAYLNIAGVWMDEQGEVHYVTHWQPLPEPPEEEKQ